MGNFTISHSSELTVAPGRIEVRYVLDLAEIPAVQERQKMDLDGNGEILRSESDTYLRGMERELPAALVLRANGARLPLAVRSGEIAFPPGAANLPTLKLRLRLAAPLSQRSGRLGIDYADTNYRERAGWKEVVVAAAPGARIVESDAPAAGLTNGLTAYPADLLTAPPQQTEARAVLLLGAAAGAGSPPASGHLAALSSGGIGRSGPPSGKRFASRFTELLTARELSGPILLLSLLVALALGAAHALEPGHGKTIVAAYLVGSRGTPKHAVWLGLIVTLSHTAGVFALGVVTLFASAYVLPERLYPWLGAVSGLAVTAVGLSLLWRHGRRLFAHDHAHDHGHDHNSGHAHAHGHGHPHGHAHDHARGDEEAPGTHAERGCGEGIRLGSLLALGISGGIVPCPGALVVLLSAIAMHRVGFGLALIAAFSAGLAAVLTGIGVLMVSARGFLDRFTALGDGRWASRLALLSAAVVTLLGLGIAAQSLASAGLLQLAGLRAAVLLPLGLGFVLGLRHALDGDHLVAVSTIVSQHRSVGKSALVGACWGLGHTTSLFVMALLMVALRISIPERVALGLEFCVALMLVALGVQTVRRWRAGRGEHVHLHAHGEHLHAHPHAHGPGTGHPHPAPLARIGSKPYFVGIVHGLAGSAALMLVVLATIPSLWLRLLYVLVFGIGSVGGMLLMSMMLSLPFVISAGRARALNDRLQLAAGIGSAAFGAFLIWQIGVVEGLFR